MGSQGPSQDGSGSDGLGPRVPPAAGSSPENPLKTRHLVLSQQGQNLLTFLNKDQARQQFCDVMVSVGGNLHRAHKVVLAHGSSYFHAELSKNPSTESVTLDHVEDSVFQHLLELLYTSECLILEKDVPALTRAARFLDMMDVLKLLCGDADRARARPEEAGVGAAGVEADVHSPASLCSSGGGQASTSDSSQSPSAQGGADGSQGTSAGTEKTSTSTRRSTRRRRTPAKYQRSSAGAAAQPGGGPAEQVGPWGPTETCTPAQETGTEDEGGVAEDDACAADKEEAPPHLDSAEHQSVPQVETRSPQAAVYPEGLAPVIIRSSNKKTLKCPKCDKSFDRAGGTNQGGVFVSPT